MGLLIAAGALLFGYATAWVASDDVRYLTRAGFEETRILMGRVPISSLAADSTAPIHLREAATLVRDARDYARHLGLEAGETYTTYSDVGRDTLLLVLTASPKHCLCPVTWWFPVVGRAPYKGFFDFKKAAEEAEKYRIRDYDVHLRPSPAFSTLGWFNDPLLSTAVSPDPVELAALVFHEVGHNTVWHAGATDFNESFAQWLGYRSAEQFFLARGDSAQALRALQRWHDERILERYYDRLVERLDSLYSANPTPAELNAGRDAVMQWARDTLAAPFGQSLRTIDPERLGARPINNAALLGVRLYRTRLEQFDEWYSINRRDLAATVFALREALEGMQDLDPWLVLSALIGEQPVAPPQ
ncbi:MAG TPA: aminopeptidase [Gemmatimonadales bacterium]|nr:aminopeptidase [Gemmatimonadales bacterium]